MITASVKEGLIIRSTFHYDFHFNRIKTAELVYLDIFVKSSATGVALPLLKFLPIST